MPCVFYYLLCLIYIYIFITALEKCHSRLWSDERPHCLHMTLATLCFMMTESGPFHSPACWEEKLSPQSPEASAVRLCFSSPIKPLRLKGWHSPPSSPPLPACLHPQTPAAPVAPAHKCAGRPWQEITRHDSFSRPGPVESAVSISYSDRLPYTAGLMQCRRPVVCQGRGGRTGTGQASRR